MAVSRYSAVKWKFFVADIFLTAVFIIVFQFFLSRPCLSLAEGITQNFYAEAFIYGVLFMLFMYLVSLPLHFADSFAVEHVFRLSEQKIGAWLADEVKSSVLSFLLWAACVEVFYLIAKNSPDLWWLITAVLWVGFSVVLARLMPVLLIPIFFKYMPIEDGSIRERIVKLAERCGVKLLDVCQIDLSRKTRKANAALVGLGKTRKVIMADTLMREFTPEEAETVVAHEFGHYRFLHMWQLLAVSGVVTVLGFYFLSLVAGGTASFLGARGPADLYMMPSLILIMSFFGMLILPVQNWFSRRLEREADRYAIKMAGSPETFIAVMKKLASMNLAETDPPLLRKILLYNHPPIGERIRMAERMMNTQKIESGSRERLL